MRKYLILLFVFIISIGFSQSSIKEKLILSKKQDNLEEYLYTFFDEYIKTKQIDLLKKGIQSTWRNPKTNDEKIALLHLKINIAYFHLQAGELSNSITTYEKALLYYQKNKIENYDIIKNCLKPLANNYTRIGDYQRAEELYKFTISTALKNNNKQQLVGTYLNLSILLQSIHKNKDAIDLLEKSLKLKNVSKKQNQQIKSAIAKNYYLLNDYKKALGYLDKLENNYQNKITKASCFHKLKNYNQAEKLLLETLVIAKTKNYSARKVAKNHNHLAKVYLSNNKLLKSLQSFQNSIIELIPNFIPINTDENPLKENLFAENTLLEALDGKAKIFSLQNHFKKAIINYQLAFNVEQLLNKTQSSQKAKIIHQQENRKRSEKIVNLYYQLYTKSPNIDYIKKSFEIVELSKAIILLEKLNYNTFQKNTSKDSLLFNEHLLVREKAILSKKIKLEELKKDKANIALIKKLINQKSETTTSLEVLKQEIQNKYPFLKNATEPVSLERIKQELLVDNQIIIEYFDTSNSVFVFSISKNKPIQWRMINKDEKYTSSLQYYINLFINDNGNKLKNEVSTYQKSAYYLYQQLLEPELTNKIDLISIIPDGKLNFLTFDALLTQNTAYSSFEKLPYLIYNKQINYSFSTTILLEQNATIKKKNKQVTVLGFFPFFENDFRKLQELTYTLDEKKALEKINTNSFFEKEQATKNQFLKNVNNYNTIHLSTHASAGDFEIPAHIEFRNETLYLPEIYGLNLQSNLMVLSACETGIGKLQKGEGTMSLARGFLYAGIRNLLVSQWKVNDKSTSILMQNFYYNYKKTNNISSSLHKAKLNYLHDKNISNLKKTPYYWSGFVFIGNNQPLDSTNNYVWIGLLLLFGAIGIYYFFRKKHN